MAGLPLSLETVPWLLAGTVLLAVALWLLYLDRERPVNRAFAAFLAVRGFLAYTSSFTHNQAPVPPDSIVAALESGAHALTPALHIAVPFLAVGFAYTYRDTHVRETRASIPARAVIAAMILFELVYAFFPDLWDNGPLFLFTGLSYLSYGLIALLFSWQARQTEPGAVKSSFRLIATGFALAPLHLATFELIGLDVGFGLAGLGSISLTDLGLYFLASHALVDLSLIPAVGTMWLILADRAPSGEALTGQERLLTLLALPLLTGAMAALGFLGLLPGFEGLTLPTTFEGLWDIALPLIVAYALLRHQLFGLDFKLRGALEQSTLAGLFAVVFLVVSESMELLLPWEGWIPSVLGATAIALALRPLQSLSARAATLALPGFKPVESMSYAERRELYQEQVEIAWADGEVTDKERRMLDATRHRLNVAKDEAQRLEETLLEEKDIEREGIASAEGSGE